MSKNAFPKLTFFVAASITVPIFAQVDSQVGQIETLSSAGACDPVCSSGPCFFLMAVAVNGQQIIPTTCVNVGSGDIIETEIRISNWGTALPNGANVYQASVDAESSARTGQSGLVLPLGWDGPVPTATCFTDVDCPGTRWSCLGARLTYPRMRGYCRGPQHNPAIGTSLELQRPDFIFAGYPLDSLAPYGLGTLHLNRYIWWSILELGGDRPMALDLGGKYYAGTLWLKVSSDACGDFVYKFLPYDNILVHWGVEDQIELDAQRYPLHIAVDCDCNDDGIPDYQTIAAGLAKDCNANGKPDLCDIRDGTSSDVDYDRIPDECWSRIGRPVND